MAPLQDVLSDHRFRVEKDSSRRPYAAFGGAVIPERNLLTRELLAGFTAQFWGQQQESAATLDGLVGAAPGQHSPLPLIAASGVARPQFMVAAQAMGLPCIPNYCAQQGGVVVDRVLAQGGSDRWWSTLTGRAKVKNLLAAYQDNQLVHQLKNPANYILCANSKAKFGESTTLRLRAELDGQRRDIGSKPTDGAASVPPPRRSSMRTPSVASGTVQLKHKLPGAEARAEVAVNRRLLLPGAADGSTTAQYGFVPLDVVLDVGTPASSASALQYKLGLHHLTTQSTKAAKDGEDASTEYGHMMHLQSGAALQGEKLLWKHSARAKRTAAQLTAEVMAPGQAAKTANAGSSPDASGGGNKPPTKTIGPHNPLRKSLGKVLSSLTGGRAGARGADGEDKGTDKAAAKAKKAARPKSAGGAGTIVEGAPLVDPDEVNEMLLDSTQSINRLREDVQGLTSWVKAGNLVRSLGRAMPFRNKGKKEQKVKKPKPPPPHPDDNTDYGTAPPPSALHQRTVRNNVALPSAHLKVGGLMGVVVRAPLVQQRPGDPRITRKERKLQKQQQQQQQELQGAFSAASDMSSIMPTGPSLSRMMTRSVDWLHHRLQGDTPQHRGMLRPFASGAMLLQLGSMQRPFLDFTRIMAKADLGLSTEQHIWGPRGLFDKTSAGPQPRGQKAMAVWHALTLSVSQQLVGSVRLCADARFALEPGSGSGPNFELPGDGAKSFINRSFRSLPAQARKAHANLVDSVVGLDVGVPGTIGLIRLVAWYAPARREGMLEVRVF